MTNIVSLQLKIFFHLSSFLKVSNIYVFIEITKKKTTVEYILRWNVGLVRKSVNTIHQFKFSFYFFVQDTVGVLYNADHFPRTQDYHPNCTM